ncbi:hypothetical protein D9M73_272660 [compost metagenome]
MRVKKVIAAITAREAIYTFIHRLDAQKLVMEDAWVTQREMPGTVATVEEITDARQAEFGRIGVTGPLFKRL